MKLLLPFTALAAAFTKLPEHELPEHEKHFCGDMPMTDDHGKIEGDNEHTPQELKDLGLKYLTHFAPTLGVDPDDYHYDASFIDSRPIIDSRLDWDGTSKGHDWKIEVRFMTEDNCSPVTTACSIELDLGCKGDGSGSLLDWPLSDWPLLKVEHRVVQADIPAVAVDAANAALADHGMTIDDCGGFEYSHNIHEGACTGPYRCDVSMDVSKVQWKHESCHWFEDDGKVFDVEVSQMVCHTDDVSCDMAWVTTLEEADKSHPYARGGDDEDAHGCKPSTGYTWCEYSDPMACHRLADCDAAQKATMVGDDEDAHGCKPSTGYSWCEHSDPMACHSQADCDAAAGK